MSNYKGAYYDMPSEEYHSSVGLSSSQVKDLLRDPEVFYKKYIEKSEKKESNAAFDIGTYFHTAVLEPDKLLEACAVYPGRRQGSAWEEFQKSNAGKAIITQNEFEKANGISQAVLNSPLCMSYLKGIPEVSCYVVVLVDHWNMQIFSEDGKFRLDKDLGWIKASAVKPSPKAFPVTLKARADSLYVDHISDLKSTSGNVKLESEMKNKVSDYSYDLSAAFYLDVFNLHFVSGTRKILKFVWIFASKDHFNCKPWIASGDNIRVGRAKWTKAIFNFGYAVESDWKFEESAGVLEPSYFEREHLTKKDIDLL